MSTENLHQEKALEKLKDMVNAIDMGMLCTYSPANEYVHAVPMSRQEVDDNGHIWMLCSSESQTYENLRHNSKLSLLYADVRGYNFMSINGKSEISQDRERIDKYWNKMIETWFEKGKEDPRIRVLKIIPTEAHYWDTKSNKLVTFFKMAVNAVSGQSGDIGREGNLHL